MEERAENEKKEAGKKGQVECSSSCLRVSVVDMVSGLVSLSSGTAMFVTLY